MPRGVNQASGPLPLEARTSPAYPPPIGFPHVHAAPSRAPEVETPNERTREKVRPETCLPNGTLGCWSSASCARHPFGLAQKVDCLTFLVLYTHTDHAILTMTLRFLNCESLALAALNAVGPTRA